MGVRIKNTIEEAKKFILKRESALKFDKLLSQNKKRYKDIPGEIVTALISRAQGEFSAFGANYKRFDPTPFGWVDEVGLPRIAVCAGNQDMETISLDLGTRLDRVWFRYQLEEMPKELFKSGWWNDRDFSDKVKKTAQGLFGFPNPRALTPNFYNESVLSNFIISRGVETSIPDVVYGGSTRIWERHRFMEAYSHNSSQLTETEQEKITQIENKFGRIFLLANAFWTSSSRPIIENKSEMIIIGKSGLLFWHIDKDKLGMDLEIPAVIDINKDGLSLDSKKLPTASVAGENPLGIFIQTPLKMGRL